MRDGRRLSLVVLGSMGLQLGLKFWVKFIFLQHLKSSVFGSYLNYFQYPSNVAFGDGGDGEYYWKSVGGRFVFLSNKPVDQITYLKMHYPLCQSEDIRELSPSRKQGGEALVRDFPMYF